MSLVRNRLGAPSSLAWGGLLALCVACGGGTDPATLVDDDGDDTVADTNTTADDDDEEEDEEEDSSVLEAPLEVVGVPNLDDDNDNNKRDWRDGWPSEDNDLAAFTVTPRALGDLIGVAGIRFELSGATEGIRVWLDDDATDPLVEDGNTTAEIAYKRGDLGLHAEFRDFGAIAQLTISEVNSDGEPIFSRTVDLVTAPFLLNHHLQGAQQSFATEASGWFGNNTSMLQVMEDELGSAFVRNDEMPYAFDVWMQDEFEFGVALGEGGEQLDIVLDSIRDRELDGYMDTVVVGPDFESLTIGSGFASSQDSFGNLEASPPVSAGGVDYPHGRVYYGSVAGSNYGMDDELEDVLDQQLVQAPFRLDTRFLCVGHIDEVTTFLPDPTAPRGFRFVISSVDEGYALLETMDAETELTRFQGGQSHNIDDVDEMLNDAALRAYNEEIQDDWLDPMLDTFIEELGLTEEEIIYLPSVFEAVNDCGGAGASLIPGMINLQVVGLPGEDVDVFMADPFMRTSLTDQSADPFIQATNELFPESLDLHYVDDFDVYHLALGEVHCGTNTLRDPWTANWWEEGRDLLGLAPRADLDPTVNAEEN